MMENSKKWFKNTVLGLTAFTSAVPAFSAEKDKTGEKLETSNSVVSESKMESAHEMKSVEAMEQERQAHIEKAKKEIEALEIVVADEENILDSTIADKNEYFDDFSKRVSHAVGYLKGKDAKNFASIVALPKKMEGKMRKDSKLAGNLKKDFTSKETVEHFTGEFTNFSSPETGDLVQTMSTVSNANNLGSTTAVGVRVGLGLKTTTSDAVTDNLYFGSVAIPGITKAVGRVIMQERKVEGKKKELSQLEQNLNDYLLANYLIPPEMANK